MKTVMLTAFGSWGIAWAALGQSAATSRLPIPTPTASTPAAPTDEFHRLLARSNGTWTGQATMTFSPTVPPLTSTSTLTNSMVMGGLFQLSEIVYTINGQQLRGVRVTGYDVAKKLFTRAMIQDGGNGVAMEGPYDPATKSTTMRYQQLNNATGQYSNMKEVYTFVDENTELLEIYRLDTKASKEVKILHVKWTRTSQ